MYNANNDQIRSQHSVVLQDISQHDSQDNISAYFPNLLEEQNEQNIHEKITCTRIDKLQNIRTSCNGSKSCPKHLHTYMLGRSTNVSPR